ncbi:hypothetical protein D9M69_333510 [compost metagenome]
MDEPAYVAALEIIDPVTAEVTLEHLVSLTLPEVRLVTQGGQGPPGIPGPPGPGGGTPMALRLYTSDRSRHYLALDEHGELPIVLADGSVDAVPVIGAIHG